MYALSALQEWEPYDELAADITDYVFAVLSEFDLLAFQEPSSGRTNDGGATSRVDVRRLLSSHRDELGAE